MAYQPTLVWSGDSLVWANRSLSWAQFGAGPEGIAAEVLTVKEDRGANLTVQEDRGRDLTVKEDRGRLLTVTGGPRRFR